MVAKVTGSPGFAILAWGLGGLIWIPQIFVLAELGTAYPQEGFGYTYLKEAGSRPLAFLYVWTVFWTSDTPSITIIAISACSALSLFYPPLDGTFTGKFLAAALIAALTYIHYRDVKTGGNVQSVLTVAKISPLILLAFVGFFYLDSGNLFIKPVNLSSDQSYFTLIVAGIAATTWSYAGFPNVLYVAGEIKNPQRNLPLALLVSVFGIMLIYVLIALATSAIIPFNTLLTITDKFVNPFAYLPVSGRFAAAFLAIAAFISMIGVMNACIMVQPRLQYAIARDGMFFKIFAHVHPRYLTPDYSILFQSALAIILIFVGNIEYLLGYFTLSYLAQNALIYGAVFKLRRLSDYKPTFRAPIWWLMVGLALVSQIYLIYGTFLVYPFGGILSAIILILTGLPIYWYFNNKRK